jgi:hypothetical protein
MSALAVVSKSQSIEVLSDAAFVYEEDGSVAHFGAKQFWNDRLGCLVANNGWMPPAEAFMDLANEACRSFDELVSASDDLWQEARRRVLGDEPDPTVFVIVFAGWSARRQALEAYDISSIDNRRGNPLSIYCIGPVDEAFEVTNSFVTRFGTRPDDFYPTRDGIPLMEKLRRYRRRFGEAFVPTVGGYVEHATIGRGGIDRRIIHHWPDRVGYPIELEAA